MPTHYLNKRFMTSKLSFSVSDFRSHFPLISSQQNETTQTDHQTIYFDNAATTQKPLCVISAHEKYYQQSNANVHRASHALSMKATAAFEKSRTAVKQLINASSEKEIIWTKGTTESINLVASSLGADQFKPGDEIVLSACEHHANIVPWQLIAQRTGAIIKVLPINDQGCIDVLSLDSFINQQTKMVCCSHISNVIGKINPIENIIAKAKAVGALTLIDGAQAIAHLAVDVQKLDCDFYVFSAHKMFGPTGLGVLFGKQALLEKMAPYQGGGEMIKKVSFNQETTFNELPFKFEAGTPNIAGVVAFEQAIDFLNTYKNSAFEYYETELASYCYNALSAIPDVAFIVKKQPDIPVISFNVVGHHSHDVASTLDSMGIGLRSGHHCAMPLMESLTLSGCLRVSLSPYNTFEEVDYFIECLVSILSLEDKPLEDESDNEVNNYALNDPQLSVKNANIMDSQSTSIDVNTSKPIDNIVSDFANVKGWDERHRVIMLMSKKLPRLSMQQRSNEALIEGCESKAWLIAIKDEQGHFHFEADSDAKLIRGLFVIILAAYNGLSSSYIHSFDIDKYFGQLGLMRHLSPSRGNGVLAIVDKIKALASLE